MNCHDSVSFLVLLGAKKWNGVVPYVRLVGKIELSIFDSSSFIYQNTRHRRLAGGGAPRRRRSGAAGWYLCVG
jgi:hypothetical protein